MVEDGLTVVEDGASIFNHIKQQFNNFKLHPPSKVSKNNKPHHHTTCFLQ